MNQNLTAIVALAQSPDFAARVQAGAFVLGLPFHPNMVLHAAATLDPAQVSDVFTDVAILAALKPVDLAPESFEPTIEQVPVVPPSAPVESPPVELPPLGDSA